MNKEEAVKTAKQLRKEADDVLQKLKAFKRDLISADGGSIEDKGEAIAHATISSRDLESCIMRLGMTLKYIENTNPYPQSYNPESPVVEPTADNLKL